MLYVKNNLVSISMAELVKVTQILQIKILVNESHSREGHT
jgi:hypothetical protein